MSFFQYLFFIIAIFLFKNKSLGITIYSVRKEIFMKKFIKTLLVTMFVLPVVGCGEDEPVVPPTNWANYLNPQGGNVTVGNEGEIELVNNATEELPEGYEIVTLTDNERITEGGQYIVSYGIQDPTGEIIYQVNTTYNVTIDYQGISFDANLVSRNHETGDKEFDITVPGYLWSSQYYGFLTLNFGGVYSTYGIDFKGIYDSVMEFFDSLCPSEEPVEEVVRIHRGVEDIDFSSIIELVSAYMEYILEEFPSYMEDIIIIKDDLVNLKRNVTVDFVSLANLIDAVLTPFVEIGIISKEKVDSLVNKLSCLELSFTLSGYELEDDALVGPADAVDGEFAIFTTETSALAAEFSGKINNNPKTAGKELEFDGDVNVNYVFNKGSESETKFTLVTFKALGDVVLTSSGRQLNFTVNRVNSEKAYPILVAKANYEFDEKGEYPFIFHNLVVDYRDGFNAHYFALDNDAMKYEYVKAGHSDCTELFPDFYNPDVDTIETCTSFTKIYANTNLSELEFGYLDYNENSESFVLFDKEGLALRVFNKETMERVYVIVNFDTKAMMITAYFDYFELGEGEDAKGYYGKELALEFVSVKLPDAVVKSSENYKGIDEIIDTIAALLPYVIQ